MMPLRRDRRVLARDCRHWAMLLKSKRPLSASTRKMLASHLETLGVHLDAEEEAIRFLCDATTYADEML